MRWLGEAIDNCEPYVILTSVDPRFAHLRGQARFEKLLRRMGLRGTP
jgi:hypothetical protein